MLLVWGPYSVNTVLCHGLTCDMSPCFPDGNTKAHGTDYDHQDRDRQRLEVSDGLEVLRGKRVSFVGPQSPSPAPFDLYFPLPGICHVFHGPAFH